MLSKQFGELAHILRMCAALGQTGPLIANLFVFHLSPCQTIRERDRMKKIVATCLLVIIVVPVSVGAYLHFSESGARASTPASVPASSLISQDAGDLGTSGLNAVLDATGAKGEIESALHAHSSDIAAQLGVDESAVDSTIDSLSIPDWEVAALPDDAVAARTIPVEYDGADAQVTLYDDDSYVTLSALGQDVTLAVPESARTSLQYLVSAS